MIGAVANIMRRSAKYRALKILKKMDIFVKNLPFEITDPFLRRGALQAGAPRFCVFDAEKAGRKSGKLL